MEKTEHGEGVELADRNAGSLAQDPLLAVTAARWMSDRFLPGHGQAGERARAVDGAPDSAARASH